MIERFRHHTPTIPDDTYVHASAVVIGEVVLESGVGIWPTAVLRGDQGPIRVGRDSNIQDGSVLHNTGGVSTTSVGERCTVGHRVILHGCTIEDEVLVGMGAIVLDNARVGRGSVIGAGALVTANSVIPPGSVALGSPARVVGTVRPHHREAIDHGWRHYRERADEERAQSERARLAATRAL